MYLQTEGAYRQPCAPMSRLTLSRTGARGLGEKMSDLPAPARRTRLFGQEGGHPSDESNMPMLACLTPNRDLACGRLAKPDGVELALWDRAGVIVAVNDAWRTFCARNGGDIDRARVGTSYLDLCDSAGDPGSRAVAVRDLPCGGGRAASTFSGDDLVSRTRASSLLQRVGVFPPSRRRTVCRCQGHPRRSGGEAAITIGARGVPLGGTAHLQTLSCVTQQRTSR